MTTYIETFADYSKKIQEQLGPDEALTLLKEGNKRFLEGTNTEHDWHEQIEVTSKGQFPYAVILSCIDSRVPVEVVFDQGIGYVFPVRIAGNFINDDILGSMEFGCKVAGSKLVVVMGHTSCGAIQGACNGVKMGHLTKMLENINPAIEHAKSENKSWSVENKADVERVGEINVNLNIEAIRKRSEILNQLEKDGEIKIVGAMYNVATGGVEFYD